MMMEKINIRAIRGMYDCLPNDSIRFRYFEKLLIDVLISYGYNEIRLPVIEVTQLFKRAIGRVTDVVEKEMYSFNDRNGESVTLRPEGTSGCVRACIEHNLFHNSKEQCFWYIGPMFRRERPQKGRWRQFHQLSVERFGDFGPGVDAEIIIMTARFWKILGISDYLSLELNSIGSSSSRILYCKALLDFLLCHMDVVDKNIYHRFYTNPIRILDSKDKSIQELLHAAPILNEYLDDECRIHFNSVCELLDKNEISYTVNHRLVRGLDYYNRTVFEWNNKTHLGAQQAICAGGRYDGLVHELGGDIIPAIGCAIGLDRLFLLMNSINHSKYYEPVSLDIIDVYIAISQLSESGLAILLSEYIHNVLPYIRLRVSYSIGRYKKHFRKARKCGARIILVIDEDKLSRDYILLKDFLSGEESVIIQDCLVEKLLSVFKK